MIQVRKSNERGKANHGWLSSRHTFSFASYYDSEHMGFRSLRVLNEDKVVPGAGFPTHPHRDMEIISYVVEGALEHKDSMGNSSVIRPGEVQRMTAGTGVVHSEYNASEVEPVRFLQVWVLPDKEGREPGYEQKHFSEEERAGRFRLVASGDGRDGSVTVHQDVSIHSALLGSGEKIDFEANDQRHQWLQAVDGSVSLNGVVLKGGDGAAVSGESRLQVSANEDAHLLLFNLA